MNDNLQIRDVLFIYISIICLFCILGLKHQLNDSNNEKLEIMKIALENDRLNKEYITILEESREALNEELDNQYLEIQEYKHLEKIKKDLARSWESR
jgi:hypothetical protein